MILSSVSIMIIGMAGTYIDIAHSLKLKERLIKSRYNELRDVNEKEDKKNDVGYSK